VSIIAWNRAEKADLFFVFPWSDTPRNSVEHCLNEDIVHEVKAGVSTNENVVRGDVKDFPEEFFHLRDTIKDTIVSAIGMVFAFVVLFIKDGEKGKGEVKLFG